VTKSYVPNKPYATAIPQPSGQYNYENWEVWIHDRKPRLSLDHVCDCGYKKQAWAIVDLINRKIQQETRIDGVLKPEGLEFIRTISGYRQRLRIR